MMNPQEGLKSAHAVLTVAGTPRKAMVHQGGERLGEFAFGDVPAGTHRLEIRAHGFTYHPVRVEVGESGDVALWWEDAGKRPPLRAVGGAFEFPPAGVTPFFDPRSSNQILAMAKNPYVLMIGGGAVFLWLMSKLIDVDEIQREMERERAARAPGSGQGAPQGRVGGATS